MEPSTAGHLFGPAVYLTTVGDFKIIIALCQTYQTVSIFASQLLVASDRAAHGTAFGDF
jgi:hypothetical protein